MYLLPSVSLPCDVGQAGNNRTSDRCLRDCKPRVCVLFSVWLLSGSSTCHVAKHTSFEFGADGLETASSEVIGHISVLLMHSLVIPWNDSEVRNSWYQRGSSHCCKFWARRNYFL